MARGGGEGDAAAASSTRGQHHKQQRRHRQRDGGGSRVADGTRAQHRQQHRQKTTRVQEMECLRARVMDEAPAPGTQQSIEDGGARTTFRDLPISSVTLNGLDKGSFTEMTNIQLAAIPHALAGRDVLGAAKTGSGKTLAFVVPVLERLFMEGWVLGDGLGAIIITPTRELALQIFEVVRSVGKNHLLSAGLLTGGKKEFREEQQRVTRMNIIVATPGRLLQHLRETPGFDPSQLQVLVLDEADRILDMGFSAQLNSILEYLPSGSRQTLLFSATQTKSVKDLARLSLRDPEFVFVHDKDQHATPEQLVQSYVVARLPEKLDMLWSFIKSHMKHKIIVFFSSCSQVRYVYECFRSMQPGVSLLALHGKIKQLRRTHIYFEFVRRPSAVLFATDIAARGLDFPACDWVLQVDAPEDTAMYIHRVGRTARYKNGGRSLLFLLPSEEPGMLKQLREANIPVKRLTVNPSKTTSVQKSAASVVASNPEVKRLAQKAFTSYMRSVALMPNKEVFDVKVLPTDEFAEALGLLKAPSLKCLKVDPDREAVRAKKNKNKALERLKEKIAMERAAKKGASLDPLKGKEKGELRSKEAKGVESESESEGDDEGNDGDAAGGELLTVKRKHDWADDDDEVDPSILEKPNKGKKRKLKIKLDAPARPNKKIVFNDDGDDGAEDGNARVEVGHAGEEEDTSSTESEVEEDMDALQRKREAYVAEVRRRLQATEELDREAERERIREKHKKKRLKERGERPEEEGGVSLAVASEEEGDGDAAVSSEDDGSTEGGADHRSSEDDSDGDGDGDDGEGDVDGDSGDSEMEEAAPDRSAKRSKRNHQAMSLQEQEEAVLKLLKR